MKKSLVAAVATSALAVLLAAPATPATAASQYCDDTTPNTSILWDTVGRTADSLFFYKNDGTAWISKLSGGDYANVGPLKDVSSGWSIIEGGV
ncbi:hypothetical protein [Streptomyces sp. NPDC054797]